MPIIGSRANASRGYFGGGTRPFAPIITSSTQGVASLTIGFTAPVFNGGLNITRYEYAVRPDAPVPGSFTEFEIAEFESTPLFSPIVISELENGTSYSVLIRAVNGLGPSPSSNIQNTQTTPRTVPNAPTITSITRGFRQLIINFNAPAFNGGSVITNYEYSLDNGVSFISMAKAVATPQTVTELADDTQFSVKVRAVNIAGNGAQSTVTLQTTAGVPFAPTNGVAVSRQSLSSFTSWSAPNNNASPISDYVIQHSTSSTFASNVVTFNDGVSTSTSANVTSLSAGTVFHFRVAAVNQVGQGPFSSIFEARTAITGPTEPSASLSGTTVSLNWTAGVGQSGFRIFRRVNEVGNVGNYALIQTVNNTSATESIPVFQTRFEYAVSSIFDFGTGIEETAILVLGSARAEVGTPDSNVSIVTNWTLTAQDTWNGNNITFKKTCTEATNATFYQVSINGGAFTDSARDVNFTLARQVTHDIKWRAGVNYSGGPYFGTPTGNTRIYSGAPRIRTARTDDYPFEAWADQERYTIPGIGVFTRFDPNYDSFGAIVDTYQFRNLAVTNPGIGSQITSATRTIVISKPGTNLTLSGTSNPNGFNSNVFDNYADQRFRVDPQGTGWFNFNDYRKLSGFIRFNIRFISTIAETPLKDGQAF